MVIHPELVSAYSDNPTQNLIVNRDINAAQEITKDQDTGGLNASVTVDHRLFTENGREDIVEDHRQAGAAAEKAGYEATEWHFEDRFALNNDLPPLGETKAAEFIELSPAQSVFHDNGVGKPELKFIGSSGDGREVVYDGDTLQIITAPKYMGTYNYVNPGSPPENILNVLGWGGVVFRGAGHGVLDVVPYFIGGNVRGPE